MKPRILGLVTFAALVLAGLWILRTERGHPAPASASEQPAPPESRAIDLAPPLDGAEISRAPALPSEPPPTDTPVLDASAGDAAVVPSGSTGSIYGFILDATGRPASSKASTGTNWVRAYDELGCEHEGVVGGDIYRIDELAPGRYWVAARVEGYRPAHREVEIALAEEAELDLVVAPSVRLAVRVLTPDGQPHPDVVAGKALFLVPVPTPEPLSGWYFGVRGSIRSPHGEGRFQDTYDRREEGLIGFLELDGDLPVYVNLCLLQWVLATELVPAGSEEVAFLVDPEGLQSQLATLRVRALDASTGEVVTHAGVMLRTSSFGMHRALDESGVTEFADISPGEYDLTVSCETYGWEQRDVLVEPGVVTEVDVELGASTKIEGRVVDGTGRAVGDPNEEDFGDDFASIYLGRLDPTTHEVDLDETMRYGVDAEGRFSLPVSRDLHLLRATGGKWVSGNVLVDARQGSIDGLEIVVHPPVDVVLRIESGTWQGARFRVLDENGIEAEHGRFRGPVPRRLALAPGTYRLLVSDPSGATLFETAFVATREPVIVPVRL